MGDRMKNHHTSQAERDLSVETFIDDEGDFIAIENSYIRKSQPPISIGIIELSDKEEYFWLISQLGIAAKEMGWA